MTATTAVSPWFTIDQLAAASGVPSRTIRLYQTKGVLPRPQRQGRVSLYSGDYVARLRLIGELQDRGLQLSAIRELISIGDGEVTVREWLGLGDQLTQPWSDDIPRPYSAREVAALLAGRRPGTLAELERSGLLTPQGEAATTYMAMSPGLLDAALALDDAGVDFTTSAAAAAILRRRLAQAVAELAKLIVDRAGDGFGRSGTPDGLAAAFEGVRVTGGEATRLIFTAEVERAMSRLVADGTLTAQLSRERPA
jgi:DNA-binding transcriptional MerR regulator